MSEKRPATDGGVARIRLVDVLCGRCQLEVVEQAGWTAKFVKAVQQGDFSYCSVCQARLAEQYEAARVAGKTSLVWSTGIAELTPEQARESTALHEAAHAVVGLALGIAIDSVSMTSRDIVKDGVPAVGEAATIYNDAALAAASPHDRGAAVMAGIQAERHWLELRDLDTPENLVAIAAHGGGDAIDLQSTISAGDYPRFAAECRRSATALIRTHWSVITAVGQHLLTHGHADGSWIHDQVHGPAGTANEKPDTAPDPGPQEVTAPKDSAPRTTTQSSSLPTEGISMSGIEDITFAISQVTQTSEQIRGALAQIQQWADEASGQLGQVLQDSAQPEVEQGIAAFTQAAQQVTEMQGLVAGAIDGICAYQDRL